MTRYEQLVELRKMYHDIMTLDYHGRQVNYISRIFRDKARKLFNDETLDTDACFNLVFSLPMQADIVRLDEESPLELSEMPKE